jgi:hypothetical protein
MTNRGERLGIGDPWAGGVIHHVAAWEVGPEVPCHRLNTGVRERKEVHLMDHQTRTELENLYQAYSDALNDVIAATDDDERVHAWRKIQVLGWRLHEVLPSAVRSLPA